MVDFAKDENDSGEYLFYGGRGILPHFMQKMQAEGDWNMYGVMRGLCS